ncbi:hypothetical protein [Mesorhizobium tianshanense]|nr:hypothetical protein [Mesorhizobium tianshanense]
MAEYPERYNYRLFHFITELDNSLAGRLYVKVGRSQAVDRRMAVRGCRH